MQLMLEMNMNSITKENYIQLMQMHNTTKCTTFRGESEEYPV